MYAVRHSEQPLIPAPLPATSHLPKTPTFHPALALHKPHPHAPAQDFVNSLISPLPASRHQILLPKAHARQITWHICFLGKVNPSMFHFTSSEHWNKGQTHHEPQGSTGARAVPDSTPCPPSAPPELPLKYQDVGYGTSLLKPHVTSVYTYAYTPVNHQIAHFDVVVLHPLPPTPDQTRPDRHILPTWALLGEEI